MKLIKKTFIDETTPSGNDFIYAGHIGLTKDGTVYHANRAYSECKHRLKEVLENEFGMPTSREKANSRSDYRHLKITRFSKSILDKDNLELGTKPLVDILRKMGWIYNDDPRCISRDVDQIIDPSGSFRGTMIEVYILDGPPKVRIIDQSMKNEILRCKYKSNLEKNDQVLLDWNKES